MAKRYLTNGGLLGASNTPATTGTQSLAMDTVGGWKITPTGACTFNATGGTVNQEVTFYITTSGTSSFNLTFGTNFHSIGVLATGTVSARFFTISFKYDGAAWWESTRTGAQT